MRRRGLTMVELLLALALLAGLMVAVASWTQIAGLSGSELARPMRWRVAAEAVLQLIHDDLVTGDFADEEAASSPRVRVADDALSIDSREASIGPVVCQYVLDTYSGRLLRRLPGSGHRSDRVLIDEVTRFACEIDEEQTELHIEIASRDGDAVSRRYLLP